MLVPANLPPDNQHVMLPRGGAIQVTGEEAYLSTLAPLVGPAGEVWIHVTLHEVTVQLARSTKTLVEVRVNDSPGGRLTPKMSGELLPALRHFASQGLNTAGRAILKGNQLKADITLYVARSGELGEEWLANPPANGAAERRSNPVVPGVAAPAAADFAAYPELTSTAVASAAWQFNAPPGWPSPPPGWAPPPGWTVPPGLPAAPDGWHWWLPAS
jgi:hypothetical protein